MLILSDSRPLISTLILISPQDLEIPIRRKSRVTYHGLIATNLIILAVLSVFGVAVFVKKAYAESWSALSSKSTPKASAKTEKNVILGLSLGIKESKKYEEMTLPQTAQTLPILQAPKNVDPQAKPAAAVLVVNDSVLSGDNVGVDGVADSSGTAVRNSDQISIYTVRNNDTLEQIADMYDVNVPTIRLANDLSPTEKIQPGQVLVILPVAGVKYTTKAKGDTIARIAKANGADPSKVAEFNNIPSNQALEAGVTIIIPDGEDSVGTGHSSDGKNVATTPKNAKPKVVVKTKSGTYFSCPVPGAVMTQNIHGHNGVDLGAPLGTPIYAPADGQVMIARSGGWNGGYGTYVVIKHGNGMQTLMAHASSITVSAGENVVKGQLIGRVGSTGDSSGNHTHYEVRGGPNTACSGLKKVY